MQNLTDVRDAARRQGSGPSLVATIGPSATTQFGMRCGPQARHDVQANYMTVAVSCGWPQVRVDVSSQPALHVLGQGLLGRLGVSLAAGPDLRFSLLHALDRVTFGASHGLGDTLPLTTLEWQVPLNLPPGRPIWPIALAGPPRDGWHAYCKPASERPACCRMLRRVPRGRSRPACTGTVTLRPSGPSSRMWLPGWRRTLNPRRWRASTTARPVKP